MNARGRPPSEEAKRKALRAAHEILMNEGFGRLTIEAVRCAPRCKPTINRHWQMPASWHAALIADTGMRHRPRGPRLEPALLRAHLLALVKAFATTRGRQIAMALAAADPESEMTQGVRNRFCCQSGKWGGRFCNPPNRNTRSSRRSGPIWCST